VRFDTPTALEYAQQGRLEEWIHAYLTAGTWKNLGAYERLGWPSAWVLIWYNSLEEYNQRKEQVWEQVA
jgi:hypothetical protein